jgi:hypothetical protein
MYVDYSMILFIIHALIKVATFEAIARDAASQSSKNVCTPFCDREPDK